MAIKRFILEQRDDEPMTSRNEEQEHLPNRMMDSFVDGGSDFMTEFMSRIFGAAVTGFVIGLAVFAAYIFMIFLIFSLLC